MPSFYKNLIVISDKEISLPENKPLKNYNCYIICNNFYFDQKGIERFIRDYTIKRNKLILSSCDQNSVTDKSIENLASIGEIIEHGKKLLNIFKKCS